MGPEAAAARSWTFLGLTLAFLDLAVAYFLLCVSALGFFCSKFLSLFWVFAPCPCRGVLGFVDSRLCFHRLLVEVPLRNISAVQVLIGSRFPFSPICYGEQEGSFSLRVDGDRGSEDSRLVLRSSRDGGVGDFRGKGVASQKQQRPARSRRRIGIGNGKRSSSSRNLGSSSVNDGSSVCGGNEGVRSEIGESFSPLSGTEENSQGDGKGPHGADIGEKIWHHFELSESFEVGSSAYTDSSYAQSFAQQTGETVGELNKTRLLEKAFEELKAAYKDLFLELEEERAAAATAAEEAMAMISRLQNEKASIEMDVRQNQRMVEEKLAYDEEEMIILKEILVRREMENFVLENEVDALKQMISSSDNNSEGCRQDQDIQLAAPQFEFDGITSEKVVVKPDNLLSYTSPQEEGYRKEPDTPTSLEILESNGERLKCLSCDHEGSKKYRENRDNEVPQVIYDVHVVDDTTEQPVRRAGKESPAKDIPSDVELMGRRGSLDVSSGLEGFGPIRESGKSSLSTVGSERLRLDSEVEWLRDMLHKVQEEKEKLKLSSENRDKGRVELKLLEEIRDQLQDIQKLREPLRHTSLPPSFPKGNLKRSRSQSASWNAQESA